MGEFRTLVLAKVLSVRDSCCLYASCTHCYRKLHQHTDGNRYECLRCHAVYPGTDIRYRYCLNLTITDDQTLCDIAVFGTCLEPFLGICANGLKSFLDNHLKTGKASTPDDPDSLLHQALQKSLVGLMFLFGFKVKCERSRSQRERHSPVRLRNILEKSCQRDAYHGKIPQLVAHQMVHANRDTPFVSVLDLLKQIILVTDGNKARETGRRQFGVPINTLLSRRSVSSSDVSWCSGNSSRTSFGQTLSRVSLGQQSLVLSCDESDRLMSSTMSDDLQNAPADQTDSNINHSYSWDETYFEENLDSESYRWQANDSKVSKQNGICDIHVEGIDKRMDNRTENRTCSATRPDEIDVDVDVQEGRHDVHQERSNASRCENMSVQFLEGAFDETCWEGEIPGNLCQEEQQNDRLSGRGDGAMGGSGQKEQAGLMEEMCQACTNPDASDKTCGDAEIEVLYNPQLLLKEASRTCEHNVPTCETSTEEEVLNEKSSFDESVNDSYLLLAELNDDGMHVQGKYNDTAPFDRFGDQAHDVFERDISLTHHDSSRSGEDIQHHVTKTSCDDLPYSEGLDTFIDQLDQPVQGPLGRLCHTGHEKDMATSNVEDKDSKHEEQMLQQERKIFDVSRNCTNTIEDNGLNMKQKDKNTNVRNVGEGKEMQATWLEDFPYSEDLDAFLAEMDENVIVESERKEEVDAFKEIDQRPISVETTVDIHPHRAETGSAADMEGSRGNLSLLKTDKGKNTDKKGRTKSLFERLVRRKTMVALNSAETGQMAEISEADESRCKGTEEEDSREITGQKDSNSTLQYRDKIVSDTDSVLFMSSSVKRPSVVRLASTVSIPDSEKGETSSTKLPAGNTKSVEQSQSLDSMENAVFIAASVENHDFSVLFDESFGHLSDTESIDSCRDSCGDAGGLNELPDTPAPQSRVASLIRASRTGARSFNMGNTEPLLVTNNGKTPAAIRPPAECNGKNLKQTECGDLHATTSDCDSPDSSPNELADTPYHDNRCRSFLSVRGASFNSTADGKCSDSAYSSSNAQPLPGTETKNTSSEEPKEKQEPQRRKSVHFSSHLESVHEVSQLTETEEVFDDSTVSKSLPTVSQCLKASTKKSVGYRQSPLQPIDNYIMYNSPVPCEGTPELYSQRLQSGKKAIKTPMSGEGTPNFFSQLSPTSADRRHIRVGKCRTKSVGKCDSTPNFFSQFSPHDSGSDGIVPGTEARSCRRRISCMLKDVVRYPADGTPDLWETSLNGGSESGDLGASPDLFGESPIPDSPVNVRHTAVMSLCKRLFHRQ